MHVELTAKYAIFNQTVAYKCIFIERILTRVMRCVLTPQPLPVQCAYAGKLNCPEAE